MLRSGRRVIVTAGVTCLAVAAVAGASAGAVGDGSSGLPAQAQAVADSAVVEVTEQGHAVVASTTATGSLLANDLDLATDPAAITSISGVAPDANGNIVVSGSYGTLSVRANSGDYSYVLDAGAVPAGGDTDVFTYTLTDQSGADSSAGLTVGFDVTVLPAAQAVADSAVVEVTEQGHAVVASTTATGSLLANDLDLATDPAAITSISGVAPDANGNIVVSGSYGTLSVRANSGDYSYVLDAGAVPAGGDTDVFTYTLTDQSGADSSAGLTVGFDVTVLPAAQAVADSAVVEVTEQGHAVVASTTATGSLLANDLNLDTDPATVTSINGATPDQNGRIIVTGSYGTLSVNANSGDYSYILDAGIVPDCAGDSDTFTYTLIDGYGSTSSASLTVEMNVTCTQPPTIVAAAATSPNANGWYNGNVVVHFTCTPGGSPIAAGACPPDQTLTAEGAAVSSSAETVTDEAGDTSAPSNVVTVEIDKTKPTIVYTGNSGTYTVDKQVSIACAATDPGGANASGIATNTCANVIGSAAAFGLGLHTYDATATDEAGNTGTGSISFTVAATPSSLCNLTLQLADGSGKYLASTKSRKAAFNDTVRALCAADLTPIAPGIKPALRALLVGAYKLGVNALAAGEWLSRTQAAELSSLASGL